MLRTNIYLEAAQAERLDRGRAKRHIACGADPPAARPGLCPAGRGLRTRLAAIDASFGGSLIDIEVTPRHGDDRAAHLEKCAVWIVILVDSDVLIAHLRGLPQARVWLRDARSAYRAAGVSVVSVTD